MDWKATLKAYLLPIDHPLVHQLVYLRRMQLRVGDGSLGPSRRRRRRTRRSGLRRRRARARARGRLPAGERGRWRIEGGAAERTEDDADLALGVGELAGAYLGGFGFTELARAGVVCRAEGGRATRADSLFATGAPKPWCPEIFEFRRA